MIVFLRLLFSCVIASMLWVTTWASLDMPLGEFLKSDAILEPWVIATLFDAYWAFITFFIWVAWKEQRVLAGILWFLSIMLLGNLAMAAYMLIELFRVKRGAALSEIFATRRSGSLVAPGGLSVLAVAIYLLA